MCPPNPGETDLPLPPQNTHIFLGTLPLRPHTHSPKALVVKQLLDDLLYLLLTQV